MEAKPQPFPNATISKKDFYVIPTWKRCMIFVFLVRFALGFNSHRKWSSFTMRDYKCNVRSFNRWKRMERVVMNQSPLFTALPETCPDSKKRTKRRAKIPSTSSAEDSPMKRTCIVLDDTTSGESGNED